MGSILLTGGRLAGLAGLVLIVASIALRLAGYYTIGGFATGTLLLAGIAAIAIGSFLLLWLIAERSQR